MPAPKWTHVVPQILPLFNQGLRPAEIARRLSMPLYAVGYRLRTAGINASRRINTAEVLRMHEDGSTPAQIATSLGFCRDQIYRHLSSAGVHLLKKVTDEEKRQMVQDYRNGIPGQVIAEKLGRPWVTVYACLARQGVKVKSQSDAHRKYHADESAFDDAENNPEAAYWVGMLMADGHIYINEKGQHFVKFDLGIGDIDHVRKFLKFLKSDYPIKIKPPTQRLARLHGQWRTINSSGMACVRILSRRLVEALHRYGVVQRKSIVGYVKKLEFSRDFWRGMVDGDGCVTMEETEPNIQLVGGHCIMTQFATFVASVLGGHKNGLYKNGRVYNTSYGCTPAAFLAKILYDDCSVALTRKLLLARQVMQWKAAKGWHKKWATLLG